MFVSIEVFDDIFDLNVNEKQEHISGKVNDSMCDGTYYRKNGFCRKG